MSKQVNTTNTIQVLNLFNFVLPLLYAATYEPGSYQLWLSNNKHFQEKIEAYKACFLERKLHQDQDLQSLFRAYFKVYLNAHSQDPKTVRSKFRDYLNQNPTLLSFLYEQLPKLAVAAADWNKKAENYLNYWRAKSKIATSTPYIDLDFNLDLPLGKVLIEPLKKINEELETFDSTQNNKESRILLQTKQQQLIQLRSITSLLLKMANAKTSDVDSKQIEVINAQSDEINQLLEKTAQLHAQLQLRLYFQFNQTEAFNYRNLVSKAIIKINKLDMNASENQIKSAAKHLNLIDYHLKKTHSKSVSKLLGTINSLRLHLRLIKLERYIHEHPWQVNYQWKAKYLDEGKSKRLPTHVAKQLELIQHAKTGLLTEQKALERIEQIGRVAANKKSSFKNRFFSMRSQDTQDYYDKFVSHRK